MILQEKRAAVNGRGGDLEKRSKIDARKPADKVAELGGNPNGVAPAAGVGQTQVMMRREDWTLFRTVETLCQKAGVTRDRLPRLVVKELVDNALDAGAACHFDLLPGNGFFVDDNGAGIPGTDDEVAAMFSIGRPLTSSKVIRQPTRGALGNGLRVVAGAVLASGGSLSVSTGGRTLHLAPRDDGTTEITSVVPYAEAGTRIEVKLGPSLPLKQADLNWARWANTFGHRGEVYRGRSSAHWYDDDGWFSMLQATDLTVRELLERHVDGCNRRAAELAGAFRGRPARELNRREASQLLKKVRDTAKVVKPGRLGRVGRLPGYPGYGRADGVFETQSGTGSLNARLPFVVEAWARKSSRCLVTVLVNRTPTTALVQLHRSADNRTEATLYGCNLGYNVKLGRGDFEVLVNVTTPHMCIATDGKEPDLDGLSDQIVAAVEKAVRGAKRVGPAEDDRPQETQKDVVVAALGEAIRAVSDGGKLRYSLRQLFYQIRPRLLEVFGREPRYNTFVQIVTDHEAELKGDLPGIYRDVRGVLYHPHTREVIPLGSLSVEKYRRPKWGFNRVLYCEKEGFFPLLIDAGWPERNDCALLTSKGQPSRAARDLMDLLDDSSEPVAFFCVHDADGPGTVIYQSLQQETRARPARQYSVVNLGLEPEEALEMGLPVEPVVRKKGKEGRRIPVADYVSRHAREWLQENRCELNAMTGPKFIDWLDRKMAPHNTGKVIPPGTVMAEQFNRHLQELVTAKVHAAILRDHGADEQVRRAMEELQQAARDRAEGLGGRVAADLAADPQSHWSASVKRTAAELVAN